MGAEAQCRELGAKVNQREQNVAPYTKDMAGGLVKGGDAGFFPFPCSPPPLSLEIWPKHPERHLRRAQHWTYHTEACIHSTRRE